MAQCRLKSFERIRIVQSVAWLKCRDDHPDDWNDGPENDQEGEQVSERLFGEWFHRGPASSLPDSGRRPTRAFNPQRKSVLRPEAEPGNRSLFVRVEFLSK
jgi:hypothetical protein